MAPTDANALLINLPPEEIQHIEGLISQFDLELHVTTASGIDEAESILTGGSFLLAILRADEGMARVDQAIRRIKRSLTLPVPLLLLLPAELAGKVRDYLRAGADEYWILPLDHSAFPPRLYVMIEWGLSVLDRGTTQQTRSSPGRASRRTLLRRIWRSIRQAFSLAPKPDTAESPESAAHIGGKWEKIRRLGFGSFGEVWLVRAKSDEIPAVAKIPHSPKMNTKFIREAAILKRLEGHRNAVQFVEVVKEEDKIILIQEYVEGSTLQELLDQGMESASKEKAFAELLEIVAYAHENKIMHRDIKPENIIINTSGVLKLLDFGTGKDLTRRSISNTVIGSRPYMAPEQIMGKSRLASDVWALGVILYALSTGFLPFYDENEKQLMDMILEVEPQPPRSLEKDLPEELESIILKCLQKDWEKRYRNGVELKRCMEDRLPRFGQGSTLPL